MDAIRAAGDEQQKVTDSLRTREVEVTSRERVIGESFRRTDSPLPALFTPLYVGVASGVACWLHSPNPVRWRRPDEREESAKELQTRTGRWTEAAEAAQKAERETRERLSRTQKTAAELDARAAQLATMQRSAQEETIKAKKLQAQIVTPLAAFACVSHTAIEVTHAKLNSRNGS
jgi:hypothetical protein